QSRFMTVRRCYVNPRGTPGAGGGPTGVIFYGSSDSIIENSVAEGTVGFNIAGSPAYDGTPGGYRNQILGSLTLNDTNGSTTRARRFGGPVLPLGNNTLRDTVFARSSNVGVYSRGAFNTVLDHVTVYGTTGYEGVAADEDVTEARCSANPDGCSITI